MRPFLIPLFSGLLLAITLTGCGKTEAPKPARVLLPVETHTAVLSDEPRWITLLGQAEGGKAVDVSPQVSGMLQSVNFKEGEPVKKGDVLFTIDSRPFEAKLNAAKAERAQAEASLSQAVRELARTEKLFKTGAESRKAYDDAITARDDARAALASAKAAVDEAALNLEWTRVTAPAGGYAGKTALNPGALLSAHSTLLTTITQHDDVRVTFAPSERLLDDVSVTLQNRVELRTERGEMIPGTLDFVSQSVNAATGTRAMRARINAKGQVLPGDFIHVKLMTAVRKDVFRIPQKAIRQEPDGSYTVFVLKDGKAVAHTVLVDRWDGPDWIVTSGLAAGDRVITNQLLRLRNGTPVKAADSGVKPK